MGNSSSNKADTSAYFSPVTGVALNVGRKSRSRENLKAQIDKFLIWSACGDVIGG
jgi:hypothetical protein